MDNNQENEIQETPATEPVLENEEQKILCTDSSESIVSESSKNSKRKLLITVGMVVIIGIIISLVFYLTSDSYKYGKAEDFLAEGKYNEAITIFRELGDFEDSEKKIMECNRRILFSYLKENNGYTFQGSDFTYDLKPDGDNISICVTMPKLNVEFCLLVDMTSGDGMFRCEFTLHENLTGTSEGYCKISKLLSDNNALEVDSYTGYYTPEIKKLVDESCDLTCVHLGGALEVLELGITPKDIGFISLD